MPTLDEAMNSGPEPDAWENCEVADDLTLIQNEKTREVMIHDADAGPRGEGGKVYPSRFYNTDELTLIDFEVKKRLDQLDARIAALEP